MITERVIKQASIIYDFMTLRHELDARFFEMGMFVPGVTLISGHKDVRQLFRHTHLNPEMYLRSIKRFRTVQKCNDRLCR